MPDFEDDWATLGRPSKLQRSVKRGKERSVAFMEFVISLGRRFVEFIVNLFSRAWTAFWSTISTADNIIGLLFLILILALGWLIVGWIRSDGHIEYCFVDKSSNGTMALEGYRAFRPNADIRILDKDEKVEVLYKTAKDINCPIGVK